MKVKTQLSRAILAVSEEIWNRRRKVAHFFLYAAKPLSPNCNILQLLLSAGPRERFAPYALLHYPASDACN